MSFSNVERSRRSRRRLSATRRKIFSRRSRSSSKSFVSIILPRPECPKQVEYLRDSGGATLAGSPLQRSFPWLPLHCACLEVGNFNPTQANGEPGVKNSVQASTYRRGRLMFLSGHPPGNQGYFSRSSRQARGQWIFTAGTPLRGPRLFYARAKFKGESLAGSAGLENAAA